MIEKQSKLLEETKQIVKSLIIPHQSGVGLRFLRKEYEEFEGKQLPYKELGFKSLTQFLQSIPDVVHISGDLQNSDSIALHPVADESTAHIIKMVAEQRSILNRTDPWFRSDSKEDTSKDSYNSSSDYSIGYWTPTSINPINYNNSRPVTHTTAHIIETFPEQKLTNTGAERSNQRDSFQTSSDQNWTIGYWMPTLVNQNSHYSERPLIDRTAQTVKIGAERCTMRCTESKTHLNSFYTNPDQRFSYASKPSFNACNYYNQSPVTDSGHIFLINAFQSFSQSLNATKDYNNVNNALIAELLFDYNNYITALNAYNVILKNALNTAPQVSHNINSYHLPNYQMNKTIGTKTCSDLFSFKSNQSNRWENFSITRDLTNIPNPLSASIQRTETNSYQNLNTNDLPNYKLNQMSASNNSSDPFNFRSNQSNSWENCVTRLCDLTYGLTSIPNRMTPSFERQEINCNQNFNTIFSPKPQNLYLNKEQQRSESTIVSSQVMERLKEMMASSDLSDGLMLFNFDARYKCQFKEFLDWKKYGFSSLIECLKSVPHLLTMIPTGTGSYKLMPYKCDTNNNEQTFNTYSLQYTTTTGLTNGHSMPPTVTTSSNSITTSLKTQNNVTKNSISSTVPNSLNGSNCTSSALSKTKTNLKTIHNFRHILGLFENGIQALQFIEEYEKIFKVKFDSNLWGFQTAMELFYGLNSIFAVEELSKHGIHTVVLHDVRAFRRTHESILPIDKSSNNS